MSMTVLHAGDIKAFSDAAIAFFTLTTGIPAIVRTAYILENIETFSWGDYQSRIELGGQYQGFVAFSAPRAMLSHVLLRIGDNDYSDHNHHDITGEIANQMSGYVRRHFGEGMELSPPQIIHKTDEITPKTTGLNSFVILISWDNFEGKLFVHINKK